MNRQAAQTRALQPAARAEGLLQRKCACGSHTGGATCTACAEDKKRLQRRAGGRGLDRAVPPIVHEVLRSPGQPLEAATRAFMEPRFARDFSSVPAAGPPMRSTLAIGAADDAFEREAEEAAAGIATAPAAARRRDFGAVRVHADAAAAESARAVDARAYTVGRDIVFGAGEYQPQREAGQRLIAHELAHVAQQEGEQGTLRRKGTTARGFFANLFRFWDYPADTLQAYLRVLDKTGDIEDDADSDDKARQIVKEWMPGGSPYVLTERRKALMIREMQKGATGDDDEVAILELLERSYNYELSYIFGAGGVTVSGLDSDFHGREWEYLKDFYDRRFEGGYQGALKGNLKPIGLATPPGEMRPQPGYSVMPDLPNAKQDWNVACVLGILCSQDKAVVAELPKVTVRVAKQIIEHYWRFENGQWEPKVRPRGAAHKAGDDVIVLKPGKTCAQVAGNIVHEVRHHTQPASVKADMVEVDAYTFTEEWSIKRGLPGRPEFRTTKPNSTEVIPDAAAIAHAAEGYSGGVKGAPEDRIVGHLPDGRAEIEHPDGTRSYATANEGDEHQDVERTGAGFANLPEIKPNEWVCPEEPKKAGP